MGNSLRCCLACVLPCGALDLIRVVHLNGHVDEFTHAVTAGEVLKNNPNHVLTKPSSHGVVRRIIILSPESELRRGSIYFLIPASSLPDKKRKPKKSKKVGAGQVFGAGDRLLPKTVPEKKPASRRDRRSRGGASEWRPHLESISEEQ
ncbi:hypothetical protein NMG60_11014437 [Bertholletia excelsa]